MSWTDERVETLKVMWTDGKSASQIAKELGGVTRNAVIGKVHRLGLSNRGPGADRPDEEQVAIEVEAPLEPAVSAQPVEEPAAVARANMNPGASPRPLVKEPQPLQRPKPVAQIPLPPQPAGAEISPEALANLAEVAKKAKRLTLMQLTERTCKWPVGDPATDDFWFCGLPSVPGKPYCDTHVQVAFQPMSSRRDRRTGGR